MKKLLYAALMGSAVLSCSASLPAVADSSRTYDEVVSDVSDLIKSKDKLLEHGAFVYCNSVDHCWTTGIVTGGPTSIPLETIKSVYVAKDTDLIKGFIHNHPESIEFNTNFKVVLDYLNTKPSLNDYLFMASLAQQGLVTQETYLWIIGPDGNLREYAVPVPVK